MSCALVLRRAASGRSASVPGCKRELCGECKAGEKMAERVVDMSAPSDGMQRLTGIAVGAHGPLVRVEGSTNVRIDVHVCVSPTQPADAEPRGFAPPGGGAHEHTGPSMAKRAIRTAWRKVRGLVSAAVNAVREVAKAAKPVIDLLAGVVGLLG